MPRPPKNRTELRLLRDALSEIEGRVVTQPAMAKRLFTSASYINAIEAGAKPLTLTLAHRILGLYGVFTSPLRSKVPVEKSPVPFAVRDRRDFVNGIRIFQRNPHRYDSRATFKHYTSRCLRALVDSATEAGIGFQALADLREAIKSIVREFRLERRYNDALLEHQRDWPPLPVHRDLRNSVAGLYADALQHCTPGMGYASDFDFVPFARRPAPTTAPAQSTSPPKKSHTPRRAAPAKPAKRRSRQRPKG